MMEWPQTAATSCPVPAQEPQAQQPARTAHLRHIGCLAARTAAHIHQHMVEGLAPAQR